jgi:5-carboxymethyl-2-hydroxymuconate isomerase
MPHIILEHSHNLVHPPAHRQVLAELHEALAAQGLERADLKSRAVVQEEVYLADGEQDRAFVHLQLALLSGRDQSVRQRLGKACMQVLEAHYGRAAVGRRCQLSVEVREMERSTYVKQAVPEA